uniref:Small ribosomal subunit protein mS23 n=1 Tax=Strigamia maritima TaxID=126957 RepID=T1IQ79_STRMM
MHQLRHNLLSWRLFFSKMAGSRTEKVGTIFSRVTGLMRSGALKDENKPIWYEVWKAFPPKFEPYHDRPPIIKEIRDIFYKEDIIRAKFYKTYPNATIDMTNDKTISISQKFIDKYRQLETSGNYNDDEIFQDVASFMSLPGSYTKPKSEMKENVEEDLAKEKEDVKIDIKVADIMGSAEKEEKEKEIQINFDIADVLDRKKIE